MQLRAAIGIGAPAERVFELLATPERLPEWNVSVETARRVPPEAPVSLGSRCVCTGRLLGQPLESETEVVVFDPPRVFATRAIRGPRLHTLFELESGSPDTTLVRVEVSGDVPGGRLGSLVAERFLRTELTASLDRLRLLCERVAW